MRNPWIVAVLCVVLVATLVSSACAGGGAGGDTTIKGNVTKVDTTARTFSINSGGRDYDFRMTGSSKGDINEIKEHFDLKKEVEVQYKAGSSPYEVVNAD